MAKHLYAVSKWTKGQVSVGNTKVFPKKRLALAHSKRLKKAGKKVSVTKFPR
jgi:hypothetical protein